MELQTYQEMLSNLVQKHPESQKTSQEILSNGLMRTIHLVKFRSFEKMIKQQLELMEALVYKVYSQHKW